MGNLRAETWTAVLERGINPREYLFEPLPAGEWIGLLDCKIWGKDRGLRCFFTAQDGRKFRLTAWLVHYYSKKCPQGADRWYTARDLQIDFSSPDCRPGQKFRLVTGKNSQGRPLWISAARLADGP